MSIFLHNKNWNCFKFFSISQNCHSLNDKWMWDPSWKRYKSIYEINFTTRSFKHTQIHTLNSKSKIIIYFYVINRTFFTNTKQKMTINFPFSQFISIYFRLYKNLLPAINPLQYNPHVLKTERVCVCHRWYIHASAFSVNWCCLVCGLYVYFLKIYMYDCQWKKNKK